MGHKKEAMLLWFPSHSENVTRLYILYRHEGHGIKRKGLHDTLFLPVKRNQETKVRKNLSSQQEGLLKEEGEQEVNVKRGRK